MKKDKNHKLKQDFIEYFRQLPIQKLAAASIGRDQDTILRWKDEDTEFADQLQKAKSEYALKNVKSVRSKEWLLERLFRDEFAPPKQKTDITSGGKPIPILGGITKDEIPTNNSNS